MDLINQKVFHKGFGEGIVVDRCRDTITVQFSDKERLFIFPDIFATFLKSEDEALQARLEEACRAKELEKAQKAQEERERKERAAEMAKKHLEPVKRKGVQPRKSDESNLAFKCNFCNGGCSEDCIGYKGVCSDLQIRYNIEVRRHSWCANPQSPCRQYLDGTLTRAELDAQAFDEHFVCYESRMLTSWTAAAGEDLNENGGISQSRRIQDATANSLAVLTTRYPDTEEEDRVIFGVFLTGEAREGDEHTAGYVTAKEGYAIELTPAEAKKMKFWNYYKNKDGGIRWGQGLYRYLKDDACEKILSDILEVQADPAKKSHAQKVLDEYRKLKGIDK